MGLARRGRPRVGVPAPRAAASGGARRRPACPRGRRARHARAVGPPGKRLGVPRPARRRGRLSVSALHGPLQRPPGSHTLPPACRPAHAKPGARPQPRSPAGALGSSTYPPREIMARVLILSWEYPPLIEGGLARHVRKLSVNLARQGTEVHVLTRGHEESPAEEEI